MKRRGLIFSAASVACAAGSALPWPAHAQARDPAWLVHRAGALMTCSQRLSKAYALLGLNIEADDAKRAVADCATLSKRWLDELLAAPGVPRETYEALDKLWGKARAHTSAAPTVKSLDTLLVLDSQMLGIANEGVAQMQRAQPTPELAAVDTAARLAMLSQRIAKFHFCALWGVAPRLAATQTTRAQEDFLVQLKSLQSAAKSPAQKEALAHAQSQWVFFDAALANSKLGADAGVHARLARSSEAIIQVFAEAAAKFARIA